MPPPPVTPSPHRFVIKDPQQAPPSAIPRVQHQREPIRQELHARQTETQQFNATPRFSYTASQRRPAVRSLPPAAGAVRVRPSWKLRDAVDDVGDGVDEDLLLDSRNDHHVGGFQGATDAIEDREKGYLYGEQSVERDCGLQARDPKRRRLSSPHDDFGEDEVDQEHGHDHDAENQMLDDEHADVQEQGQDPTNDFEDLPSSVNTAVSSPPQFATPRPLQHQASTGTISKAPRFRLVSTPHPAPHQTPQGATEHQNTPFAQPPRFRPPTEEEQTKTSPGEPLPDAFSPQRRGQKFLVGGLAGEVVGWVMNLESNTTTKIVMDTTLGAREEKWLVKMLVSEVRGGAGAGMTLIRGRSVKLGNYDESLLLGQSVILAGVGVSDTFRGQSKVEVGKLVGIRGPVWEIMLEGREWGVAVNWAVLD